MDGAALDAQVHVVQRLEAAELHQHALGHEQITAGRTVVGVGSHRYGVLAAVHSLVGAAKRRPAEEQLAHESHNTVLQVIDHKKNHQTENAQAPVGDRLQPERKHRQCNGPQHRNRHGARGGCFFDHTDHRANQHQRCQRRRHLAEHLQVIKQLGQDHDDGRAQQRAGAALAPTHDDRQQEQHGQLKVVGVGRDVLLRIRIQAARQAGKTGADHKGIDLVAVHRHAHAVGGHWAAAQRFKSPTELGFQNAVYHHQRQDHERKHHPVKTVLGELGAKKVGLGDFDTQRAFGQKVHLVDQNLDPWLRGGYTRPRTMFMASSIRSTACTAMPSIGFFGALALGTTATVNPNFAASFSRS